MSLDADTLVDRRRMRRKLSFWRGTAFVLVALAVIVGIAYAAGFTGIGKRSAHIARLSVSGVILENRDLLKLVEKISKTNAVKGVIVSINSPGGSTTGGEALYQALRKLAEKKPVVAEIRTVGASAGYMVALAADHIVAHYNSITGSIGVLFQFGNVSKLMQTMGIEMDAVKSAPLKAEPDFYSETSPEARAMLKALVMDSYDWFVNLVAERRGLSLEEARRRADGQIYTGHKAQDLRLIDAIGGEDAAIAWLETERSVAKDLPVINWSVKEDLDGLPLANSLSRSLGEGFAKGLSDSFDATKGLIPRGLTLDGLVSVWQAPGAAHEESEIRGGGQ